MVNCRENDSSIRGAHASLPAFDRVNRSIQGEPESVQEVASGGPEHSKELVHEPVGPDGEGDVGDSVLPPPLLPQAVSATTNRTDKVRMCVSVTPSRAPAEGDAAFSRPAAPSGAGNRVALNSACPGASFGCRNC